MSIICVARKNGTACIVADTLTKFGATKESAKYIANSSKIITLPDAIVAAVGHASVTLSLQIFFNENSHSLTSIHKIYSMSLDLHDFLKERCFLNPQEDGQPFETSRVNMLIASKSGIFGLYDLRSVQEYTRFYAFGSGDNYALGAMYTLYEEEATALEIARIGALAACEFDDGCEGPIDEASIELEATLTAR